MNENISKNKNTFAMIALLATLGITIAGFMWLHVDTGNAQHARARAMGKMSLEERVQLLDVQLDDQQEIIRGLQTKVLRLENAISK